MHRIRDSRIVAGTDRERQPHSHTDAFIQLADHYLNLVYYLDRTMLRKHCSYFDVSSHLTVLLWIHLKNRMHESARLLQLHWALYFVKNYRTIHFNAMLWKCYKKLFQSEYSFFCYFIRHTSRK